MIVYGINPVLESLRAGRVRGIRLATASSARTAEVRRLAAAAGTPVTLVPSEALDRATGGGVHQGVLADVSVTGSTVELGQVIPIVCGATSEAYLVDDPLPAPEGVLFYLARETGMSDYGLRSDRRTRQAGVSFPVKWTVQK